MKAVLVSPFKLLYLTEEYFVVFFRI
ncbi:hypothetical protein YQE_03959, partial [Dendroctonus ponderosae]